MFSLLIRWLIKKSLPRLRRHSVGALFCVPGDNIGDSIFLDGLYEGELLNSTFEELLGGKRQVFASSTCLDVGANIGNHSLFFSHRFASVLAFEPNPVFCLAFRATMACNRIANVKLFECGLGARQENLPYVQAERSNLGGSRFVTGAADASSSHEATLLEIRTGDETLAGLNIPPVALIKIDVEGLELDVLKGLRNTLDAYSPVVAFEAHPEVDRAAAEATVAYLRKSGYADFYTCEQRRVSPYASIGKKALNRLRYGTKPKPMKLTELEDREYLMLIASKSPLVVSC
jgi:FkbM family methyltransferase